MRRLELSWRSSVLRSLVRQKPPGWRVEVGPHLHGAEMRGAETEGRVKRREERHVRRKRASCDRDENGALEPYWFECGATRIGTGELEPYRIARSL